MGAPTEVVILDLQLDGGGIQDIRTSEFRVEPEKDETRLHVRWSLDRPPDHLELGNGVAYLEETRGILTSGPSPGTLTPLGGDAFRFEHWSRPHGVMVIMVLPQTHTLRDPKPDPVAAKAFENRIALYWILVGGGEQVTCSVNLKELRQGLRAEIEFINRAMTKRAPREADKGLVIDNRPASQALPPPNEPRLERSTAVGNRPDPSPDVKPLERMLVFSSGVVFLAVMLAIAAFNPHPTAEQHEVFKIVLALGAAAFVIFVPGFINVEVPRVARAGGALAVFVIVYFYSPAVLVTPSSSAPASTSIPVQVPATAVPTVVAAKPIATQAIERATLIVSNSVEQAMDVILDGRPFMLVKSHDVHHLPVSAGTHRIHSCPRANDAPPNVNCADDTTIIVRENPYYYSIDEGGAAAAPAEATLVLLNSSDKDLDVRLAGNSQPIQVNAHEFQPLSVSSGGYDYWVCKRGMNPQSDLADCYHRTIEATGIFVKVSLGSLPD